MDAVEVRDGGGLAECVVVPDCEKADCQTGESEEVVGRVEQLGGEAAAAAAGPVHQHPLAQVVDEAQHEDGVEVPL